MPPGFPALLFRLVASGLPSLLASGSLLFSADNAPVNVIVLAGQSNLAGRGPAADLPERYRTVPSAVLLDYVCSFGGGANADVHHSRGWVRLGPAAKHENTPGEHFGPELGLGHALASALPGERIALIKHGRGATSLAEDWQPDATDGPRLYRALLEQVRAALDRLALEGRRTELRAFVWVQGEADSTRTDWARAYEQNLRTLVARVRRDLAAPRLPCLVVLTGKGVGNERMIDSATVRQAQQRVTGGGDRIALVDTDDLPLLDSVHFNAPGQLRLGERIARGYLDSADPAR
ncbi:MAG: hypothetical protein EXS43_13530 [Opitutus sp.]|nr:hypothetical protein [Opitutus sp.]